MMQLLLKPYRIAKWLDWSKFVFSTYRIVQKQLYMHSHSTLDLLLIWWPNMSALNWQNRSGMDTMAKSMMSFITLRRKDMDFIAKWQILFTSSAYPNYSMNFKICLWCFPPNFDQLSVRHTAVILIKRLNYWGNEPLYRQTNLNIWIICMVWRELRASLHRQWGQKRNSIITMYFLFRLLHHHFYNQYVCFSINCSSSTACCNNICKTEEYSQYSTASSIFKFSNDDLDTIHTNLKTNRSTHSEVCLYTVHAIAYMQALYTLTGNKNAYDVVINLGKWGNVSERGVSACRCAHILHSTW